MVVLIQLIESYEECSGVSGMKGKKESGKEKLRKVWMGRGEAALGLALE